MRLLMTAFIILGFGAVAHGADVKGDALAGKKAAASLCAECHDTSGNAEARNPPGNAPPFSSLAQSRTPEKLRQYLMLPHGRMDNVIVTGRDVDDVVAYIRTLRRP
jgi:mono/diheme cytochrome c family protein